MDDVKGKIVMKWEDSNSEHENS